MIDQPLPTDTVQAISSAGPVRNPYRVDGSSTQQIRQIFLQWEWLRIWYNVVLVAWVLLLTGYALSLWSDSEGVFSPKLTAVFWPRFALVCLEGAAISNLCFFLGPAVEAYAGWLGKKARWLRPTLFWSGLFFTMLGAFVTIQFALVPLLFITTRSS